MTTPQEIMHHCDGVILAGGKATRMGGCNKLLQQFGQQRQLEMLLSALKPQVQQLWINSHRDHAIYRAVDDDIGIFSDQCADFLGSLEGMRSAWEYSQQPWILFVPCDIYQLPDAVLQCMAAQISTQKSALCYARINEQPLYPLCLMHRSYYPYLAADIEQQQYSLHRCFAAHGSTVASFSMPEQAFHSINSHAEQALASVCTHTKKQ